VKQAIKSHLNQFLEPTCTLQCFRKQWESDRHLPITRQMC